MDIENILIHMVRLLPFCVNAQCLYMTNVHLRIYYLLLIKVLNHFNVVENTVSINGPFTSNCLFALPKPQHFLSACFNRQSVDTLQLIIFYFWAY